MTRPLGRILLVAVALLGGTMLGGASVGSLVVRASLERPLAEWLLPVAGVFGTALGLLFLAFVLHRLAVTRGEVALGAVVAFVVFTSTWANWVRMTPASGAPTDLKRLTPMPANANFTEVDARRPKVTYRTNSLGFRGDEWPRPGDEGRVALVVGDSFVFGMGVEEADTLTARADRQFEAMGRRDVRFLNLGVPGGNLRTHVDVLEAALGLGYRPALVFVCITSNDFAGWNPEEARAARRSFGGYSLATFVLGDAAGPWLRAALFGLSTTAKDEERMRVEELLRLRSLASSAGFPLQVFAFTPDDRAKLVPPLSNDDVVTLPELKPAYFIPDDGHPTPEGNAAFAQAVAAVAALLLWSGPN